MQKGGKPNCLIDTFGEVEQWNFDDQENYQQWQWQQQKKTTCQWGNVKLQQAPYAQTNNNGELSLLINSLIACVTITADPGRETLLWLLNASISAVRFFTPSAQTS